MPVSITTRLGKGAPLTPSEMDTNLTNLKTAADDAKTRVDVALDGDGNLKDQTVSKDAMQVPAFARNYYEDSGSANLITITIGYAITVSDLEGVPIQIKVANAITTATQVKVISTGSTVIATLALRRVSTELTANQIVAGQVIEIVHDGSIFQLISVMAPATVSEKTKTGFTNLVVTCPASAVVTATADAVVMVNASGVYALVSNFSKSADVGAAMGAGGRDVNTARAAGWLHVYGIAKSDLSASALVFSSSATGPTMANITGYTDGFWCRFNPIYDPGSGSFLRVSVKDHDVFIANTNLFTGAVGTGAAVATLTALTSTPLANFKAAIPPTAARVRGTMGVTDANSGAMSVAGDTNGLGEQFFAGGGIGASGAIPASGFTACAPFDIPVLDYVASGFFYRSHTTGSAHYRIDVSGYRWQ